MPCNSDYMRQNDEERQLQETAKLLSLVLVRQGKSVPDAVMKAADDQYCRANFIEQLCAEIKAMPTLVREKIVYDAHDRVSREIAGWWERHIAADDELMAAEAAARKQEALAASAISKLTVEERAALGL